MRERARDQLPAGEEAEVPAGAQAGSSPDTARGLRAEAQGEEREHLTARLGRVGSVISPVALGHVSVVD